MNAETYNIGKEASAFDVLTEDDRTRIVGGSGVHCENIATL